MPDQVRHDDGQLDPNGFPPSLVAEEGGAPMDQSAVMTAPTTSACAAITSIVLAAVSNMRMGWSPAGTVPAGAI